MLSGAESVVLLRTLVGSLELTICVVAMTASVFYIALLCCPDRDFVLADIIM